MPYIIYHKQISYDILLLYLYVDLCMKSEAQHPIVSWPCVSPKPCKVSGTFTCPCIKNQCKCGKPPLDDNNSIPSSSITN